MSYFFFSSRRRHTRWNCDWSSDVCSSDLSLGSAGPRGAAERLRHSPGCPGKPRGYLDLAAEPGLPANGALRNRLIEQRPGALLVLSGAAADHELRVAEQSHRPEVDRPARHRA